MSIACNGCRKCCHAETIILHPDKGDVPADYQTVETINPITGEPCFMLAHKENLDCIYLGESGCTIYERRPLICREFDCRLMVLKTTKRERAVMERKGGALITELFDAGDSRMHTLTSQERREAIQIRNDRLKRESACR